MRRAEDLSPFVIGAESTQVFGNEGVFAETFARCHAIVCPEALDSPFLAMLLKVCAMAQFAPDPVARLGHREIETPNLAGGALTLALKRSNLIRWLEQTTHCGPLGSVGGRIAQIREATGHHLGWHDDLNDSRRRLGITIELSEQPYEGGLFELRLAKTRDLLLQFRHAVPGSALIFDVSSGIEHRVLPITSGGPRRVYAGWFLKR